jgi:hypothetical protein
MVGRFPDFGLPPAECPRGGNPKLIIGSRSETFNAQFFAARPIELNDRVQVITKAGFGEPHPDFMQPSPRQNLRGQFAVKHLAPLI